MTRTRIRAGLADEGSMSGGSGSRRPKAGGKQSSNRQLQIRIALIGAAGAVLAAVAGALISLHPWSSGAPAPSASPTAAGGLQISISAVEYPVGKDGKKAIRLVGTVRDEAANDEVYAFAGAKVDAPPFYYGGPAAVSSGTWTAEITSYQGSPGSLAVWAGVLTLPPSTCPGLTCPTATRLRGDLTTKGPRAPEWKKVTPAFHTTFPGG